MKLACEAAAIAGKIRIDTYQCAGASVDMAEKLAYSLNRRTSDLRPTG
jgi:hypothetical protein